MADERLMNCLEDPETRVVEHRLAGESGPA
jgi:hypothetical protein